MHQNLSSYCIYLPHSLARIKAIFGGSFVFFLNIRQGKNTTFFKTYFVRLNQKYTNDMNSVNFQPNDVAYIPRIKVHRKSNVKTITTTEEKKKQIC